MKHTNNGRAKTLTPVGHTTVNNSPCTVCGWSLTAIRRHRLPCGENVEIATHKGLGVTEVSDVRRHMTRLTDEQKEAAAGLYLYVCRISNDFAAAYRTDRDETLSEACEAFLDLIPRFDPAVTTLQSFVGKSIQYALIGWFRRVRSGNRGFNRNMTQLDDYAFARTCVDHRKRSTDAVDEGEVYDRLVAGAGQDEDIVRDFVAGYSDVEIAARVGMMRRNVQYHRQRGFASIRQALELQLSGRILP